MCRLEHHIGTISPDWAENWETIEGSPSDVLVEPKIKINPPIGKITFIDLDKYLPDKRDVDWGSGAWRGKRCDFEQLLTAWHIDLDLISFMNDEDYYAFVFIELW